MILVFSCFCGLSHFVVVAGEVDEVLRKLDDSFEKLLFEGRLDLHQLVLNARLKKRKTTVYA